MKRIERFLALLHYNSAFGHSNLFAMHLDGDGSEKVTVTPITKEFKGEVNLVGGIGGGVEIAGDGCYYAKKVIDLKRHYLVKRSASLYINDDVAKTIDA